MQHLEMCEAQCNWRKQTLSQDLFMLTNLQKIIIIKKTIKTRELQNPSYEQKHNYI